MQYSDLQKTTQWQIQDFREVGAPNLQGASTYDYTIMPNFPKNCLKLKEFGRGAHPKFYFIM